LFGPIFQYKLGRFATLFSSCIVSMHPLIELNLGPGFVLLTVCPWVSLIFVNKASIVRKEWRTTGTNSIKPFWSKFTLSLYKLDCFTIVQNFPSALKWSSLQTKGKQMCNNSGFTHEPSLIKLPVAKTLAYFCVILRDEETKF
jgi:hypothetical protein